MYHEMTDTELIAAWREEWDEIEAQGGQSTEYFCDDVDGIEAEVRRRGLRPTYECTYAPYPCAYGCPADRPDYWEQEQAQ